MRYYVYASDSKIEMLYEQVPRAKRESIASELNINLGLIQARFSSETVEAARHQKLLIIREFLAERVGGLSDGKPYSSGCSIAAWGPMERAPDVVYFGGMDHGAAAGTHYALVGSLSNCLGMAGTGSPNAYSLSYYVLGLLSKRGCLSGGQSAGRSLPAEELKELAFRGVEEANTCSIRPDTSIEFLARTIAYRPSAEGRPGVYIGSPLFVAECDRDI